MKNKHRMRTMALATTLIPFMCFMHGASASEAARTQDNGDKKVQKDIEEVVTVGSRRAARSAADTPAPVDVIGQDDFRNQGDTDIQNILRTSVPSYNVNTQPISDAATLVRPANLRGLSPDSTLVLVNGKRRHRAAVISFLGGGISDGAQGPDISVIPAIALKQIEVLRDGAASQYGSDAIAGVMNFALRDSDSGINFEADYGSTYAGDGGQYSISGNIGLPLPFGQGGFINISAEFGEIDATSRSVQRDDALALIAAGNTEIAVPAQIWGQPNVNNDLSLFVNLAVPFSEALEVYAFGNYAERQAEGGFFFRNPNTRAGVFSNTDGASLLVGDLTADGTGNCPVIPITNNVPDANGLAQVSADPDCFAFNEIFPGGFTPRFGGDLQDQSIVFGLKGEISLGSGVFYDVSYTYGQNDVDFFINNTINASLGPDTPLNFRPGGYSQIDNNFNLDLSYGIANTLFASDVNVAVGFEHRTEEFEIRAGDPASFEIGALAAPSAAFPSGQGFSSSSNGFGGFTPASAGINSQNNYALYFDTEVDVTENLIVQAAIRYEDFYDSFGDTVNYKIGALYRLSDTVTARSTWSTGFRAPTAGQANVTNVTTAFTGTVLQDQGTIPLSSVAGQFIADRLEARTGARPELGAEQSRNFTLGLAFSLADINLTVDYFRIDVDNRISISDQQDFLGELTSFAAENNIAIPATATTTGQILNLLDTAGALNSADFAGSEDLVSFGFFSNSFDTRTQGIDVIANTSASLYGESLTTFNLAFNWTDTTVTDRGLDTAAPLSGGRARQLEDNTPATRGNFTVNHTDGRFRALSRLNYFGSFFECHLDALDTAAPDFCELPIDGGAQVTFDFEVGYQLTKNVELIAGVQNLFDSFPDENPFAGVAGSRFPANAPAGFSGGLYYVRLRANF